MRYTRIHEDGNGGSRTSDVDVPLRAQPFAVNVPPLMVGERVDATGVVFVEFPEAVRDTEPHPTPHRQFGVILDGVAETRTTDGEVRRYSAGSVVLLEDTQGAGHTTSVLEPPFRIMFVPLPG